MTLHTNVWVLEGNSISNSTTTVLRAFQIHMKMIFYCFSNIKAIFVLNLRCQRRKGTFRTSFWYCNHKVLQLSKLLDEAVKIHNRLMISFIKKFLFLKFWKPSASFTTLGYIWVHVKYSLVVSSFQSSC